MQVTEVRPAIHTIAEGAGSGWLAGSSAGRSKVSSTGEVQVRIQRPPGTTVAAWTVPAGTGPTVVDCPPTGIVQVRKPDAWYPATVITIESI